MRKSLVVGNWKMNGSKSLALELISELCTNFNDISSDVAICPPYPYLLESSNKLVELNSNIKLGAQNVSAKE